MERLLSLCYEMINVPSFLNTSIGVLIGTHGHRVVDLMTG